MKSAADGLTVNIFGKEFMISCPADEREPLLAAAAYLDQKMHEIHDTGKVIGTERTAVMAALNITHELLALRDQGGVPDDVGERLRILRHKIDAALG